MGSAGPSGSFDLQSFFKVASGGPLPPGPAYSNPSTQHPYSAPPHYGALAYPPPAPANLHNAPTPAYPSPFNTHASYASYMHYNQDHGPRPPPPYSTPSSFNHLPSTHSLLPHVAEPQPVHTQTPAAGPPLDGARLMALLTTHSAGEAAAAASAAPNAAADLSRSWSSSPVPAEVAPPEASRDRNSTSSILQHNALAPPPIAPAIPTAPPVNLATPSATRMPAKRPTGRVIHGDKVVYDIDVRFPREAQPQLEVSPITVYGSEPVLVLGRQIAVNRDYICYALRAGTIRILNSSTALRALLRGHTQRVTDMAFPAEDLHLLASASSDGRVYVRRIEEGTDESGKLQINENIVLAFQLLGDWQSAHPIIRWHTHMQKLLYVAIGKYLVAIDVIAAEQLAPPGGFTVEDLVKCDVRNPPDGVYARCGHDGDVTSLAVSDWLPNCVATASSDGVVRFWGSDRTPFAAVVPHDGQPVGSVGFLTSPGQPSNIVLFTAGPLNRELKLWAQTARKEVVSPPLMQSWSCIQTLEFQSSAKMTYEGYENTFFNQLVVVPDANLILLANAKKNAIYAVHVEFGASAAATHMNYIAEFSVTMPILSLTATSDVVANVEGTVQVYCVQTQAIQLYTLDMAQCLPSPEDDANNFKTSLTSEANGSPISGDANDSFQGEGCTALVTAGNVRGSVNAAGKSDLETFGASIDSHVDQAVAMSGSVKQVPFSGDEFVVEDQGVAAVSVPGQDRLASSDSVSPMYHSVEKSSVQPTFMQKPGPRGDWEISTTGSAIEDGDKMEQSNSPLSEDIAESTTELLPPHGLESQEPSTGTKGEQTVAYVSYAQPTSSTISSQEQSLAQSLLLTPSQLMKLAAGSGNSPLSSLNPAGSNSSREGKVDAATSAPEIENLSSGGKAISESSPATASDVSREEESFRGSSSTPCERPQDGSSLNYQPGHVPPVDVQSFSGYEEDAVEEVMLGEVSENFEERDGSSLHFRESHEVVKESQVTKADTIRPIIGSVVTKGRKNKNKANIPEPSPLKSPGALGSVAAISSEAGATATSSSIPGTFEVLAGQVLAMQDSLNQLISMQKELQKQMAVIVAVPVAKEGKRMEGSLGQRLEKVVKAHGDAQWARMQEENAKRERADRDRSEQVEMMIYNCLNKEMPAAFERVLKKEISSTLPTVAKLITPYIEKAVATVLADGLQKSLSEKVSQQLEKLVPAKLDACVSRQLQTQFQSSGRQIIQDSIRASFEGSIIPAFDRSCRTMFEQVDAAFQQGMAEHTSHVQQQFNASHSALASTLQDAVASATSLAASLKGEIADGQRKLLALAENAGVTAARATLTTKQSNGVLSLRHLEESLDPTIELTRLLGERKLDEAFNKALSLSDVAVVSWLCTQVDPEKLFSTTPLPLNQGVLLSLVQQLGCELGQDTSKKLTWIQHAALALNPNDPVLAPHMRPFLEQLYQNLHRQMLTSTGSDMASLRLVIHVVNSLLTSCK